MGFCLEKDRAISLARTQRCKQAHAPANRRECVPCPPEVWERAEAEAAKERETHERMVEDFQMLLDQKSKAQTDRMVRLGGAR